MRNTATVDVSKLTEGEILACSNAWYSNDAKSNLPPGHTPIGPEELTTLIQSGRITDVTALTEIRDYATKRAAEDQAEGDSGYNSTHISLGERARALGCITSADRYSSLAKAAEATLSSQHNPLATTTFFVSM